MNFNRSILRRWAVLASITLLSACGGVQPTADRPTLTVQSNWETTLAQTIEVPVAIEDDNPNGVVVTAVSWNPTLLPDSALVVSGSGDQRTLSITANPDSTGTAAVTIVARSEGGIEATSTISVTITAPFQSAAPLAADSAAPGDSYGESVAVSGNLAIVGAIQDNIFSMDHGYAYVFTRSGGTWQKEATLTASDGAVGDEFGRSVAISGDRAIVGAPADESGTGAAYVFARTDGTWTEVEKLTASNGIERSRFGVDVAISGDRIVVGANVRDVNGKAAVGSAYIFERAEAGWNEVQILTGSENAGSSFGYAVDISGDDIIIGALGDDNSGGSRAGSAYVFERTGTSWTQTAQLTASVTQEPHYFGSDVAIDGDYVIVGAPQDRDATSGSGYATVFKRTDGLWGIETNLMPDAPETRGSFGHSVAISGADVLVGAPFDAGENEANTSRVHVYARSGAGWEEVATLGPADEGSRDLFGSSVAISDDAVVVGAPEADPVTPELPGSASLFTR